MDGSFIFLKHFQLVPWSPFSKVQMSSLVRNPEGKRQLRKWRRHSLTAQSVLELEGNDG